MGADQFSVLAVDDSKMIRYHIRNMLNDIKVDNIFEASDGREALNMLEIINVDLIISDWNMPGLTGQELLEQVRLNEKTKKTPFIMLTAEGEQEKVLHAIQAGVTNYIVKPFTAQILYKKIRPFLPPKILANVDRL